SASLRKGNLAHEIIPDSGMAAGKGDKEVPIRDQPQEMPVLVQDANPLDVIAADDAHHFLHQRVRKNRIGTPAAHDVGCESQVIHKNALVLKGHPVRTLPHDRVKYIHSRKHACKLSRAVDYRKTLYSLFE